MQSNHCFSLRFDWFCQFCLSDIVSHAPPTEKEEPEAEVEPKAPEKGYGTLGVRPPAPVLLAPEYRRYQPGYVPGKRPDLHYGVWTRLRPHLPNAAFRKISAGRPRGAMHLQEHISVFGLPPGLDTMPPGMRIPSDDVSE